MMVPAIARLFLLPSGREGQHRLGESFVLLYSQAHRLRDWCIPMLYYLTPFAPHCLLAVSLSYFHR